MGDLELGNKCCHSGHLYLQGLFNKKWPDCREAHSDLYGAEHITQALSQLTHNAGPLWGIPHVKGHSYHQWVLHNPYMKLCKTTWSILNLTISQSHGGGNPFPLSSAGLNLNFWTERRHVHLHTEMDQRGWKTGRECRKFIKNGRFGIYDEIVIHWLPAEEVFSWFCSCLTETKFKHKSST